MPEGIPVQIGIAVGIVVAVVWLLKEVIGAAKSMRDARSEERPADAQRSGGVLVQQTIPRDEWVKLREQTDDMHKWHDVRDEDGRPIWYITRAHGRALDSIAESTNALASLAKSESVKSDAHLELARSESVKSDAILAALGRIERGGTPGGE